MPTENTEGTERRIQNQAMKSIFSKLAERYQGKKFFTTIAAYALGGYLISQGHAEAGAAVIGIAQGSFNIGQGMADGKKAATDSAVAAALAALAAAAEKNANPAVVVTAPAVAGEN